MGGGHPAPSSAKAKNAFTSIHILVEMFNEVPREILRCTFHWTAVVHLAPSVLPYCFNIASPPETAVHIPGTWIAHNHISITRLLFDWFECLKVSTVTSRECEMVAAADLQLGYQKLVLGTLSLSWGFCQVMECWPLSRVTVYLMMHHPSSWQCM
jgi:hypothetical protein